MASALDLLLSRQAAAAGVGIGTRRNRVLPAPPPTTNIPGRTGTADYALRKSVPVCVPEDLMSPLTETSYAARTYHATRRQYSTNGVYSFPLKPINRITVSTGDGLPKTRALCMAADDGSTGLRVLEHDIIETGRTYTAAAKVQRVYINGTYIPVAFDARLSAISFGGKCGRPFSLQVYPTGGVAAEHGSIFGAHVLGTATITSARVMGLNAKTTGTLKKFEIVLASPGKLVERIEDAAWTVLNSLVTPLPNEEFPWNRRVHRFAGLRCFQRVNGNIYTDQTLSTLIDATARPASFGADTEFPPRYFKLTANADYTSPSTNYVFPSDAIFPRRMFCFPEAVYTGRMNPFRLLPTDHIFKCAAGQVWRVGVTITAGAGSTDNFKIYLRNRFDSFLESSTTVDRLIGEVNAKNWSAYPAAPADAPTKRPTTYAITSKPDGSEAYVLAYWDDTSITPASDRRRTLTSVLRVELSETGASDPATGVGISTAITEVDVFAAFVNTSTSSDTSTPGSTSVATTVEDLGPCGSGTLHKTTQVYTALATVAATSSATELSYRQLLWVYARHTNEFDLVEAVFSTTTSATGSGTIDGGTRTFITTEYCDAGTTKWNGVGSGEVATHLAGLDSFDAWIEIRSSVRGVLVPKIGVQMTLTQSTDPYFDYSQTWAYPAGPAGGTLRGTKTISYAGTFYGGLAGAFAAAYSLDYDTGAESETGTRYTLLSGTSDEYTTLWLASGAAYHSPELRVFEHINGAIQDYSAGAGIGPRKFTVADKVYHGHVVPLATPIQRVCVNARAGTAYIAPSDADAGHFY